ncbi:unnamed protein product [Anisakis simplex]|uniref:BPI2 domain-containing protein n=1 Tax=Anisakis simplex TaxID=6269 RepID=A0A0M3KD52_ANISI|nr:unnamed protein product [Anisakis simplex]
MGIDESDDDLMHPEERATPRISSQTNILQRLCAVCPSKILTEKFEAIRMLLRQSFDAESLDDISLSVSLKSFNSTRNDQTVDVNGEFSARSNPDTLFGAFPMVFPQRVEQRMAEILIGDFTLNSLLYHIHQKQKLSLKIRPHTIRNGKQFLRTTCVQDDGFHRKVPSSASNFGTSSEKHIILDFFQMDNVDRPFAEDKFTDNGDCIGLLMPKVGHNHPNKYLNVHMHSARAPSVIFKRSGENHHSREHWIWNVVVDIILAVDFFIDDSETFIGSLKITTLTKLVFSIRQSNLFGKAFLNVLELNDTDNSLGIPEENLNNLRKFGKRMVLKPVSDHSPVYAPDNLMVLQALNEQLSQGIPMKLPQVGLPIELIQPQIDFLDHALHISTDFIISTDVLKSL